MRKYWLHVCVLSWYLLIPPTYIYCSMVLYRMYVMYINEREKMNMKRQKRSQMRERWIPFSSGHSSKESWGHKMLCIVKIIIRKWDPINTMTAVTHLLWVLPQCLKKYLQHRVYRNTLTKHLYSDQQGDPINSMTNGRNSREPVTCRTHHVTHNVWSDSLSQDTAGYFHQWPPNIVLVVNGWNITHSII